MTTKTGKMKKLLKAFTLLTVCFVANATAWAATDVYVYGNIGAKHDSNNGWGNSQAPENKMTKVGSNDIFYYDLDVNSYAFNNGTNYFRFIIDNTQYGASNDNTGIGTGIGSKQAMIQTTNNNFTIDSSTGNRRVWLVYDGSTWYTYVTTTQEFTTPTGSSEAGVFFYYKAPTIAEYKVWAWTSDNGGYNQTTGIGTDVYNNRPSMTAEGVTYDGNVLYKYTFGGTAVPVMFQVTKNGSNTIETNFTNGGVYTESNNAASLSETVATVPVLSFRSSITNWYTNVSNNVMTYDSTTGTYTCVITVPDESINSDFYFKFYANNGITWIAPLNTESGSNIYSNESQQGTSTTTDKSWKLLQSQSLYKSYTFIVKPLDNNRYLVTAKGKDGRTEFKKGLFLVGTQYDSDSPQSQMHYSFKKLPNSDNEYYFDLLGTEFNGVNPVGIDFRLALVREDNGNVAYYGWNNTTDEAAYNLFAGDLKKDTKRELVRDGKKWNVSDNGGMYRLIVTLNDDGTPSEWRYESYPNTLVMYRVGDSSNWTATSFLYRSTDDSDAWFQGTGYMENGEGYKWLMAGNKWIPDGNNLTFSGDTGVYLLQAKTDGTAAATDQISNLVFSSNGTDTAMTYDIDESCWYTTVDLANNQTFTFNNGGTTWGEDSNTEYKDYNHVVSTSSTAATYTEPAGTMKVRFFHDNVLNNWNTAGTDDYAKNTYFYTIEGIEYAPVFTMTPQIGVTGSNSKNRVFINNAKVDINVTNGSKSQLYFDGGKSTLTSATKTIADGSTILVSTPGVLNVGDGKTVNNTGDTFDFAYSTSDNYVNFWNNSHNTQSVATGGKDCITIFVRSQYDDTGIYAWDWGRDAYLQEGKTDQEIRDETTQRDKEVKLSNYYPGTFMTDERTLEFNGEKWYYMAFPIKNLLSDDEKKSSRAPEVPCLAVIVNRMNTDLTAQEATDYADSRKTAQKTNILTNSFFGYTYDPTIYGESGKYADGVVAAQLGDIEYRRHDANIANRTKVTSIVDKGVVIAQKGSWSNIYAHYYNSETGVDGTVEMTATGDDTHWYAQIPEGYDRVEFNDGGSNSYPANGGAIVLSGGYYTQSGAAADRYPTILYLNEASTNTYNTFLNTEIETTVETVDYPNGRDYYKSGNANDDLTLLLDPTWNKAIANPTDPATDTDVASWSGISNDGYAHQKLIAAGKTLSQDVYGLNSDANYTVQAIVYSATAHNNATLKLNGATEVTETIKFPGTNAGYVTKYGRVEKLGKKLNSGKNTLGWTKVEATVKARANGSITITLTNPSEYVLADVTLLENANTPGHFWTKAPTSNSVTDYDLTGEKKFSFFDRGDNLNAVIFAGKNAVITMDADRDPANATEGADVDRQAPYNVVLVDGENNNMEHLYLTEANSDGLLDPTYYDDADLKAASLGAFYTSGHSFGITKNYTFNVEKATFDRKFKAETPTAVCLPFNITREQIENVYGTGSKVYTLAAIDSSNGKITYKTNDNQGVTANVPFLLYAADQGSNLDALELTNVTIGTTGSTETSIDGGKAIGNYEYLTINTHPDGNSTNYTFNPVVDDNNTVAGKYSYANNGCIMKPFRFYLQTGYIDVTQSNASFSVLFIDEILENTEIEEPVDEPTDEPVVNGIETVATDRTSAPIFGINGQVVSHDGKRAGLNKGIYIQNGKKFVIK